MNIYFQEKKEFFRSAGPASYEFRIDKLRKLKSTIKKYEEDIILALTKDLGKPEFESYTSEIGVVYEEINYFIKNLKKLMKRKRVRTPIYAQPALSRIYPQAKGVVFIISPWNYPFQLLLIPLVGALAAGNCILAKPSNKTEATSAIITKIIGESFKENHVSIVNGPGSEIVDPILKRYDFDHIFFTGSTKVGKHIMKMASRSLTPVTLELGGKSPVIVMEDSNLEMAAKKITWGKFYNAGQTCIAPDYLLVEESAKDELISHIKRFIKEFYSPLGNKNISRIVSGQAFDRLVSYLNDGELIYGGNFDRDLLFIEPSLLEIESKDVSIMEEEIFGPILPIISFNKLDTVLEIIDENPYPLALYLFTEDKSLQDFIINRIQFGAGCINNTIHHFVNSNLPFGGIRYSGIGNYHARASFDSFSHYKSILKSPAFDLDLKYPKYTDKKLALSKLLMK